MSNFIFIAESVVFVCALSLDAFAASLAYGTQDIKMPVKSILSINFISTGLVGLGIEIGSVFISFLSIRLISVISFLILISLGFIKIFEFSIKRWIKKNNNLQKDFYFLNFHFLLEVITDSIKADFDCSKELSVKEAYTLGVVLSLDGFAAGVGAGLLGFDTGLVMVLSFAMGFLSMLLGGFLGRRLAEKTKIDLSWISGAILLIIALLKL